MKAEELRIGNYIHENIWNDYVSEIDCINHHSTWLTLQGDIEDELGRTHELDLNQIKPIPITEEWLDCFGFKQMLIFVDCNYHEFKLEKNGFTFEFDIDLEPTVFFYLNGKRVNLKYVHQLQNLYFALTGKELTLTSPSVS